MRAGRRNERVLIREPIEKNNEYGEKEVFYVNYINVWANISKEKGREFFASSQINNTNPMQITINFSRKLTEKFIVVYEDNVFEIKAVVSSKKRNETKIYCSETS